MTQSFSRTSNFAGQRRVRRVAVAIGAVFAVLAGRAAMVSLEPPPEADGVTKVFEAPVRRADILDRNGELLATSVDVYSLFADPRAIWDADDLARRLATVLEDIDVAALSKRLADRDRAFVWVRRGLTPRQRKAVFDLGLEGLGFRKESRRAYPRGTLAGHVLGFAGVDGQGLAGLEHALDDRLSGRDKPVRLTLDTGAQFALEAELAEAARHHQATGAAGVLTATRTGEILALASWPAINPNRATEMPANAPARLNRATGAVYELGSVFKPLSVAAALDAGALQPDARIDVSTPLEISGTRIADMHPIAGPARPIDIIAESSNLGTVRIARRAGLETHKAFLEALGLFEKPPIALSGSAAPLLPETWDELTGATVSYGHGIAVSPLAFTLAFASFANDGQYVAPRLVLAPETDETATHRVMTPETARQITQMLREAVTRGTGKAADVAGYRVAGKTGTAEKPVDGGYDGQRNVTSFAALFPADRPDYALLIVLDQPKAEAQADGVMTGVTAAHTAAPAAGRVIERIAPLLGVAPRLNMREVTLPPVEPSARQGSRL